MSMIRSTVLAALTASTALVAVEPELRLGSDSAVVTSEILSQYVHDGALRSKATTWRNHGRVRYLGLGLQADLYATLEEDRRRELDTGDLVETRLRADYLIELPGLAQIMPTLRYQYFPAWEDEFDVDEPLWLGVEGWYLLPFEGLEVGGSIDYDLLDEHGWFAEIGARQLAQIAPLDLQSWQLIGLGDGDYHAFTAGNDDSGLGALQLGGLATLPLPWNDTYATLRAEYSYWLRGTDRDSAPDNGQFSIGIGFEWRPGLP